LGIPVPVNDSAPYQVAHVVIAPIDAGAECIEIFRRARRRSDGPKHHLPMLIATMPLDKLKHGLQQHPGASNTSHSHGAQPAFHAYGVPEAW